MSDNQMITQNELRQIMLSLCSEFYEENKMITIKRLYLAARRRTSASSHEVQSVIDELIADKIIVPDSFIIKPKVLDNDTRQKIFKFLSENPGVSAYDIKKDLGLGNNMVAWHLNILMEFDLVKEISINKKRIFTTRKTKREFAVAYYYLNKKDEIPLILGAIGREMVNLDEIVDRSALNRKKVRYYLQRFQRLGLIRKEENGGTSYYVLPHPYKNVIPKLID